MICGFIFSCLVIYAIVTGLIFVFVNIYFEAIDCDINWNENKNKSALIFWPITTVFFIIVGIIHLTILFVDLVVNFYNEINTLLTDYFKKKTNGKDL